MSLMDFLERIISSTRTKHLMQTTTAGDLSRRASEKTVASDLKLLQFDSEVERIDETLHRLRDQGALLD